MITLDIDNKFINMIDIIINREMKTAKGTYF